MSLKPLSIKLFSIQSAFASPVELPNPVMFSSGRFIPWDCNQACIAGALSAALAVNIWTLSTPYLAIWFFSLSNKGPGFPSVTLLKSVKSIVQPSFIIPSPTLGQSADAIFTFLPSFVAIM